jgi:hypothetical protein
MGRAQVKVKARAQASWRTCFMNYPLLLDLCLIGPTPLSYTQLRTSYPTPNSRTTTANMYHAKVEEILKATILCTLLKGVRFFLRDLHAQQPISAPSTVQNTLEALYSTSSANISESMVSMPSAMSSSTLKRNYSGQQVISTL